MIVTGRFVFLHLHKSGGTFVNQFLLRFFAEARLIGYHLPRAYLPLQFNGLPLFGLVRNPWEYYVSWYSFQVMQPVPNPLYDSTSENGRLGFAGTLRNIVTLGEQSDRLSELRSRLPERFTGRGINLTRNCLALLAGSSGGFYSFMYRRMYGDGTNVTFGRTESLRTDLAAFLESRGIRLNAEMTDYIRNRDRPNTSVHRPYWEYYDDATRELVALRDASVIERFGYRFDTEAKRQSAARP
ncbi:MAG: hypothetical protein WAW79_12940 [Steroidobacteraceae bacterium]